MTRILAIVTVLGMGLTIPLQARADWSQLPGAQLQQVSVGSASQIVGVNQNGNIWRYSGGNWTQLPGALTNVSVASDGALWGINSAGNIYRWLNGDWSLVAGPTGQGTPKQISVGSASQVWMVTTTGAIFHRVEPGWALVPGGLTNVSVSASGYVMGVNQGGGVFQWTGGNDWRQVLGSPGAPFIQISNTGSLSQNMWAVAQDGGIYFNNGAGWIHVNGALSWVAAASDGTVWGANAGNNVYIYLGTPTGTPATCASGLVVNGACAVRVSAGSLSDGQKLLVRAQTAAAPNTPASLGSRFLGVNNGTLVFADSVPGPQNVFVVKALGIKPCGSSGNLPEYVLQAPNGAWAQDTGVVTMTQSEASPFGGKTTVYAQNGDAETFVRWGYPYGSFSFTPSCPYSPEPYIYAKCNDAQCAAPLFVNGTQVGPTYQGGQVFGLFALP